MSALPSKLLELKEEFNRLNDEIREATDKLLDRQCDYRHLQNEINKKELELTDVNKEVTVKLSSKEIFAQRNGAVRDKMLEIDEKLREEAECVADEKRMFLRNLGIRMHMTEMTPSFWEIKISFIIVGCSKIILNFNNLTDIFSLVSIFPEPPRIEEIREFLDTTNDVGGFLCHCRKYFLNQFD